MLIVLEIAASETPMRMPKAEEYLASATEKFLIRQVLY